MSYKDFRDIITFSCLGTISETVVSFPHFAAIYIFCSMNQNANVIIKPELCKACGLCIEFCPKKVLHKGKTISSMGYEFTVYVGEGCIGCGTCFYVCPEPDAIVVIRGRAVTP